jgi:hypothetical protein
VHPPELRAQIASTAMRVADLHRSHTSPAATKAADDQRCPP